MIKVWPIHKHKWRVVSVRKQTYVFRTNNEPAENRYTLVRVCYCGKHKVTLMNDLGLANYEVVIEIVKAKGWEYDPAMANP